MDETPLTVDSLIIADPAAGGHLWPRKNRKTVDSLIIADPAAGEPPTAPRASGARWLPLPLVRLADGVPEVRANIIALGALARWLALLLESLESAVIRALAGKEVSAEHVRRALAVGHDAAASLTGFQCPLSPGPGGLKLVRPDLTVIVASGDGDVPGIGGNHFLHACRRNVDLTCIMMDNEVYGMTKDQPSPTTPPDWNSRIAPGGIGFSPLQPLAVALAAGASFIARGFPGDRRLFADDGSSKGIFYQNHLPSHTVAARPLSQDLRAIEAAFAL